VSATVSLRSSGRLDVARTAADGSVRCTCPAAGPDSGVLFVDAPVVSVRGTTSFPLTIATTGTLVVDGDTGIAVDAVPKAALGLVAQGPIRLQMADRETGTITDRHLRSVALVSLAHSVVTDRWDDRTSCRTTCPTLYLAGASAGAYRPLIGSYDPTTGRLVGGYRKQLRYLPTLADDPPPYALSEAATAWRRVDAIETGAGTPGLLTP
jgi:hypothetical protein